MSKIKITYYSKTHVYRKQWNITIHNWIAITDVCYVLFLVCLYICVCECLLPNNIAGVPSSRATSGFPQYCASTCARFGCTRHASCVDSKPKMSRAVGQYKCRIRASRVLNQNSQDINRQKKTGSAFSDALLMSRFQISMLAPQLKICAPHGFEKSRGVNSLINYRIAKQSEIHFCYWARVRHWLAWWAPHQRGWSDDACATVERSRDDVMSWRGFWWFLGQNKGAQ